MSNKLAKYALILLIIFSMFLYGCNNTSNKTFQSNQENTSINYTLKNLCINLGTDENTLYITWFTDNKDAKYMQINENTPLEGEITELSSNLYYCQITWNDVLPDTTYSYKYGLKTSWSDVYTFTTYDDNDFNFLAVGDTQIGTTDTKLDSDAWCNTLNNAYKNCKNISFITSMGDQVDSSTTSNYDGFFSSKYFFNTPLCVLMGNHEYDCDDMFDKHFHQPNCTDFGDYYYTYNNCLFISINSNYTDMDKHIEFLTNTADKFKNKKWCFVTLHHSMYTVTSRSTLEYTKLLQEKLSPVLDNIGADIVFSGHDHVYIRTKPLGESKTIYNTLTSSSGSKYYDIVEGTYDYTAVVKQEYIPCYTYVQVTDHTITVTTYRSTDNSILDTYKIGASS